jgi:hypothetical protein
VLTDGAATQYGAGISPQQDVRREQRPEDDGDGCQSHQKGASADSSHRPTVRPLTEVIHRLIVERAGPSSRGRFRPLGSGPQSRLGYALWRCATRRAAPRATTTPATRAMISPRVTCGGYAQPVAPGLIRDQP